MLDLESVRLFVLAADLGNLTRAAEAAGTVQPVVSQRLKGLEGLLGHKLLERTPRYVRLTEGGVAFLPRARALLASHDDALLFADQPPVRFTIGASDHALGLSAEAVFRRLRRALPNGAVIDVRMGLSQDMQALFDAGSVDAAILRRERGGSGGEVVGSDPLGWRAAEDYAVPAGVPVPLATLAAPCGVRAAAIRHLNQANMPWRDSFVAGSCAALLAGVRAGFGIAPMGALASGGMADVGPALGLPTLPDSQIVLLARTGSPAAAAAIRALVAELKAHLR
jgi:DNA-binding transcriptional LysR family regulator